jgi:hypothetical protein
MIFIRIPIPETQTPILIITCDDDDDDVGGGDDAMVPL